MNFTQCLVAAGIREHRLLFFPNTSIGAAFQVILSWNTRQMAFYMARRRAVRPTPGFFPRPLYRFKNWFAQDAKLCVRKDNC